MPYPPAITLRPCTLGGSTALESGTQLVLSAEITASRSLKWGATGWQFPSLARTVTGSEGAELSFSLPVTDLAGWRLNDDSGSIIDVSAPGSYTHTYTIKLKTLSGGRQIDERVIGPFVLPTEDLSPIDLDLMLPAPTVAGGVVSVPGTWDARVAAAEALLDQVPAAVDAYLAENPPTGGSGVDPTDTGFDIVLLLGQSNMSGRGTPYNAYLDPIDPRVWQYGASGTYDGAMSVAFEPLAQHDTPSGIGPGLPFARWYAASIPSNRRVLLVPAAHGGTALSTNTTPLGWRYGVSGNLAAQAITQAQEALAAAGANSRIVAALWHQGEQDAYNNVAQSVYEADLDALIAGIRAELGEPDLPFIIGRMVPEYTTGTAAQIDSAHVGTPGRVANVAVATYRQPGMTADNIHYNAAAQRLLGRSMFDALINPGTPDTTAPSIPAGLSATAASSTSVTLAWSASTDDTSVTGYEYRIGGGAAIDAGAGLTETVTGLTASTPYSFEVRAYDAAGNRSDWSTAASATTDAPPADSTPPTVGTMAASSITATGFTLTVSGASDETALHATPYAFTTNGTDWTAYQASPIYVASGLAAETGYSCNWRVRDAAGNVSSGTAQTVTTGAAVVVAADTFTRADSSSLGATETGGLPWVDISSAITRVINVTGGKAAPASTSGVSAKGVETAISDASISATVVSNGTIVGIAARSNGTTFIWLNLDTTGLTLYTGAGVTPVTIGAYSFTPSSGTAYALRLDLLGDSITAYLDGVARITVTSTYQQAETMHGITGKAPAVIDDFQVVAL